MSFSRDFAYRLQDLGFGTAGTDIWAQVLPNAPDTAVAIFDFGGGPTDKTHGGVVLESSSLQIQVRNKDVGAAEGTITNIFRRLDNSHFAVNGTIYLWVEGTRNPGKLRVDENNRTILYCEFQATRRLPWEAQNHSDSIANWSDAVATALA